MARSTLPLLITDMWGNRGCPGVESRRRERRNLLSQAGMPQARLERKLGASTPGAVVTVKGIRGKGY